jgi:hypothetical protein
MLRYLRRSAEGGRVSETTEIGRPASHHQSSDIGVIGGEAYTWPMTSSIKPMAVEDSFMHDSRCIIFPAVDEQPKEVASCYQFGGVGSWVGHS